MPIQGSVAEAWSVLSVANSLQKQDSGYSGNQERQLLSALKAVFPLPSEQPVKSAAYEALLNGQAGFPDSTAVFIVGMPRSGSTLVEQILASHPGVVGAGELRVKSSARLLWMSKHVESLGWSSSPKSNPLCHRLCFTYLSAEISDTQLGCWMDSREDNCVPLEINFRVAVLYAMSQTQV